MKFKFTDSAFMFFVKSSLYGFILQIFLTGSLLANNRLVQISVKETNLEFALSNVTVKRALLAVEEKTPYSFYYNPNDLDSKTRINIKEGTYSVYEILIKISRQAHLSFRQVNNYIAVSPAGRISPSVRVVEEIVVTGTVSDENGRGLPGVNVIIKGTPRGVITDAEGKYTVNVDEDGVLVFSFIGYKSIEERVGNRTGINVQLQPDVSELNEIVVTAMAMERDEASLGYSVASVGAKDVESSGASNLIDAMNGKISGVQIINAGGGMPGGGTSMIVRGYTSLNFSNQPLYVVDGIPINNDSQNSNSSDLNATTSANRAVDINPADIASISVLKGGAATALYGIRAANGVVIITTKKGVTGAKGLNIEYSNKFSVSKVNKLHETTNNFVRGNNGIYSPTTHSNWGPSVASNPTFPANTTPIDIAGDGIAEDLSGQPIPLFTDNYKRFWDDAHKQQHNLTFSSGGPNNSLYGSVSTMQQTGVVPNSDYYKHSFLFNAEGKVNDKIKYSGKANYINTGGKRFRTAGYGGVLFSLAYHANIWDAENFNPKSPFTNDKTWFSNSVPHVQWVVQEQGEDWNLNRWIGGLNVTWDIAPWLALDYRVGLDNYTEERREVKPFGSVRTANRLGEINELILQSTDMNNDVILRGKRNLGQNFDLSYLGGVNVFRSQYGITSTQGTSFVLTGLEDISNTLTQAVTRRQKEKMLVGVYGNAVLGYKDMIYLDMSARNDWSSTLPENNNSFLYPSTSLTFVASEVMDQNWLSLLKFRAAYARTANDAPIQSLINVAVKKPYNVFGRPMFTISNNNLNPNIKPETTDEVEFGFDVRVLDGLFGLDASFYNKTSNDQIILQPVPAATGFSTKLANLGEVNNKGVELQLSVNNPVKFEGLLWTTNFNFTKNVGKIIRIGETTKGSVNDDNLDRIEIAEAGITYIGSTLMAIEGESFGTIVGYPYQRSGPLDYEDPGYLNQPLLLDNNGLPLLGTQKVILGNINPDWILGINSNAEYKGVRFGFTLERKQGGDVVNGFDSNLMNTGLSKTSENRFLTGDPTTASAVKVFEGVTSDGNINTMEAQLTQTYYKRLSDVDEEFVEDASWWRLRNIYVGYRLPASWLARSFMTKAEITFTARNAWLSTPYTGNDPELSAHGIGNASGFDTQAVPNTKSFDVGIKIGF